jgi:hypothetical protein
VRRRTRPHMFILHLLRSMYLQSLIPWRVRVGVCVCAYVFVYVFLCACLFGYLCLCMPVSVPVCLCLCVQVDTLRTVTLPQLARYGITSDVELKVRVQGHRDCLSMLAPLYARWCVRHTQRERDTHTGTLHQPRSLPLCVPIRTGACLWACRAPAGALT